MIETVLAWLAGWWPLLALPLTFSVGYAAGWWLRGEDGTQARAELKSLNRVYTQLVDGQVKLAAAANEIGRQRDAMASQVAVYKRDGQALRALIEQHTVKT